MPRNARSYHCKLILVAAHSASRGGAEYCLDTFLTHLDRERFDAQVLFAWDGPMAQSARALGYHVEIWPWAWWMSYQPDGWYYRNLTVGSLLRVTRLLRRFRKLQIDLVYTNTAVIFEPALAAWLAGIPHVWHVHEILTPTHTRPHLFPLRQLVRWIGRWSRRVVFESNTARQVCQRYIPQRKMRTVYNSVRFSPPGQVATKSHINISTAQGDSGSISPDGFCRVVWIGRFSERKDPLAFVHAIARMQRSNQCRFVLVGEGPLAAEVRRAIQSLALTDRCQVLPFQDDIRPVLQSSDFLVLTSREESFGLVLIEAAAYGLPAVATRTQGPTEIIVDGKTGLLVEPGNVTELALAMDRLVAYNDMRREMGLSAAQRASELFCPRKNTRQLELIFLEAIGSCNRAAPGKATGLVAGS
jgi:glycosyltransferase involved in cell wall biosynthesis